MFQKVFSKNIKVSSKSPRTHTAIIISTLLVSALSVPVVAQAIESQTSVNILPGARDPLAWPFARDSIWNMPIGSSAQYVPAGLASANAWRSEITIDPELISMNPSSPIKILSTNGQAGHNARVRVPVDLAHDGSWNGCSTLLSEDSKTVWSGQPLRLTAGGNPSWQYTVQRSATDLRGPGIEGCHGGSGMSGVGGSVRVGELNSSTPLRHALKLNIFCKKYCWKGTSMADSKRWPALSADSYWASGYGGQIPALRMGALLALPPTTDLSSITDPKARKIAISLRDYGGYVVDDTAWDVHAVNIDHRMKNSGEWPSGSNTAFHAQMQKIFTMLNVVNNNTSTSIGGGGTPRVPLAPCFEGDVGCTTTPTVTPVPTSTSTQLSKLVPTRVINGYGPLEVNSSNGESGAGDGRTLTIAGRTFATGLGVHATSDITYALGGKYSHFNAQAGVDDEVGSSGSVIFEVWVDGVLKQRTVRLTGANGAIPISVSVWRAQNLRLVVTPAGDGMAYDHADWAAAELWASN